MKTARVVIISAVVLAALFLAATAALGVGPLRDITGTLAATGDKLPAWKIYMEEPLVLGEQVYDVMEVYSRDEDISHLAGKRVTATGSFVQWRTRQRGGFVVLEICDIVPTDELAD